MIDAALCRKHPELQNFGVYRVIDCKWKPEAPGCNGRLGEYEEFIPYCHPVVGKHQSMNDQDVKKWMRVLEKECGK